MARFPNVRIRRLLAQADTAATNQQKGALLEEAMAAMFDAIPGVAVRASNVVNVANTGELDLLCWNRRYPTGLYHLETPFIVECKNWGQPVGNQHVTVFANSLRSRSCRDGILIASNGITGASNPPTEVHFSLLQAIGTGQRILVVTRAEIEGFRSAANVADLLEQKILDITIKLTRVS